MSPDLRFLWEQLQEDWTVHNRDWTTPGFRALATHRVGNWIRQRRSGRITGKVLWFLYMALYRYIRNHYGIEVYYSTKIGRRVKFGHQSGIVIHPNAKIGDDCLIRQNVTIGASSDVHGQYAPKLGNRVQVGAGAVIVGKVVIGDDVSIGPNVTVATNIPAGTIVSPQSPRLIKLQATTTPRNRDGVTRSPISPEQEPLASKE
jgi:serine acetyltransferase